MVEYIGKCVTCNKEVFCEDGFLNGVYENDELYCFSCAEENNELAEKKK